MKKTLVLTLPPGHPIVIDLEPAVEALVQLVKQAALDEGLTEEQADRIADRLLQK